MREHKAWLYFLLRRGWLFAQGLIRFGPGRTRRSVNLVRMALDAFEGHYGRGPSSEEQVRLVRKLAWFDQHYQRNPSSEEMTQLVQQLELR